MDTTVKVMETTVKWYEDPVYIKMVDCPEIQYGWSPSIGDYTLRRFTVFGEPLDSQIWSDDDKQEIEILHYHSETASEFWTAVTPDGQSRVVSFPDSSTMVKSTCLWLPTQSQLQAMLPKTLVNISPVALAQAFSKSHFEDGMEKPHTIGMTMEQLWLVFVMKERWNKVWNGEEWLDAGSQG